MARPAPAYWGSPLVRSSPLYKESPRGDVRRTATARSITGTTAAARSVTGGRIRAPSAQRSARVQAPEAQTRTTRVAAPTRPQARPQARPQVARASQRATRVRPTDTARRVVVSTRRSVSSNGTPRSTPPSARTPAARPHRSSRAPANAISRAPAPPTRRGHHDRPPAPAPPGTRAPAAATAPPRPAPPARTAWTTRASAPV